MARPSWFKLLVSENAGLEHFWHVFGAVRGADDVTIQVRQARHTGLEASNRTANGTPPQQTVIAAEIGGFARGQTVTLFWTVPDMDLVVDAVPVLSVPPAPQPQDGPDPDDSRRFVIPGTVDPFVAAGLVPLMSSPEVREKAVAPGGWLETHLLHSTQPVSFVIEFGVAGYADAAVNPSFWEPLGTTWGQLDLSGDYSAGFTLTPLSIAVTYLTVAAGSDYNLATSDDFVASGGSLTIDATALGEDEHIIFDGSAETDGRFVFMGGDSSDTFLGGAGDDWIWGAGGADGLSGGGGADRFIYRGAGESTGADYDTIGDFNPASDRIDLHVDVRGFATTVSSGALSRDSFDADLGALLGGLGTNQAAWVAPDSGDLAGTIFLVIDANGQAGYQAGEDYVIAIGGSPLEDLTGHTGFFI